MQSELRKLAKALRDEHRLHAKKKFNKCAQVVNAALALEYLRRKLGK